MKKSSFGTGGKQDAATQQKININLSSGKHVREMYTILNPLLSSKTGGFRGMQFFLILIQNIDCGYSFKPPQQNQSFEQKYHIFFNEIFIFYS